MEETVLYVEHREVTEVTVSRAGSNLRTADPVQGIGITRPERGVLAHRFWVPSPLEPLVALPQDTWGRARALLWGELGTLGRPEGDLEVAQALKARFAEHGVEQVEMLIQQSSQRVLCGPGDALVEDWRRFAFVEVRAFAKAQDKGWSLWRCAVRRDTSELLASLPALLDMADDLASLLNKHGPPVPCPAADLPIVFPPGAASGCFFHEVCGHPLEGDVVAHSASYLARRMGEQVAEPFVNVSDSPVGQASSCSYGVDDEGVKAQRVKLLSGGRVDEPLLDLRMARHLGRAPNGHGRRVSFQHPAIPRMGHTQVEPHQGTLESFVRGVGRGLLVRHLTPRHMDLLSGDFSFFLNEAQLIQDGELGPLVGPAVLRGNGLTALRAIDAVGEDSKNLFSTRGCRKLDHGPLHVSFGQPSIRFQHLRVDPWI